jgi:hypothetical protein
VPTDRTLYLRGAPGALVRAAKAEAARRGVTLTAFVLDAIERALDAPVAEESGLADDMRWFERNRARLVERYEGEHVAIVDREVVDHDEDFGTLADRVLPRFGSRSIFMPRCVREEREVRVRSPRSAAR